MNYKQLIKEIETFEDFKLIKSKVMGQEGPVFELQSKIKIADKEEKASLGSELSKLRKEIDFLFEEKMDEIQNLIILEKIKNDKNDIFSFTKKRANNHPLQLISNRFRDWFVNNGYFEYEAIEIENDLYNFERLNVPKDHPSRDMQDTLFIDDNLLLRTHNTGISARLLEENKNTMFSAFTIGKVYRNDEDDATHSHQFTQVDFTSVGDHSISTLVGTLKSLLSYVFEEEVEIRLRPSFFPFTEPSVEVDVFFKNRWIEILGSGMFNEKILELAGYEKGFKAIAAGIGVERVAMIKYGIKDIREFYKNDLRFLNQFK